MADQKKIGGFGLIGILIVIAVIALASGGGLYWNETKKQQSFLQTGADVIKRAEELKKEIESRQKSIYGGSTSINSNVDTSEWKTYRNEKYGFEVKYPTFKTDSKIEEKDQFIYFDYLSPSGIGFLNNFAIGISKNDNRVDFVKWFDTTGSLVQFDKEKLDNGGEIYTIIGPVSDEAFERYGPLSSQYFVSPAQDLILSISQSHDHDLNYFVGSNNDIHELFRNIFSTFRPIK